MQPQGRHASNRNDGGQSPYEQPNDAAGPQHDGRHDDKAHQQRWMCGRSPRSNDRGIDDPERSPDIVGREGQVATLRTAQRDELGPSQGE